MENTTILREWFGRVDTEKTGSVTAPQLKTLSSASLNHLGILVHFYRGRGYIVPNDVYEALVKIGFSLDCPAFYTVCEVKLIS
ncbi:hypothetical protein CJ030_MR5G022581 [Morella rubra]|uniref:Uncharacterized protein n=1 Tax=Morella rubra TaxID=262757 RepID=A0A6A1VIK5_9ROSI|nr:hypothetical protein CJ030_MR5G022581 [Morella rubra]